MPDTCPQLLIEATAPAPHYTDLIKRLTSFQTTPTPITEIATGIITGSAEDIPSVIPLKESAVIIVLQSIQQTSFHYILLFSKSLKEDFKKLIYAYKGYATKQDYKRCTYK